LIGYPGSPPGDALVSRVLHTAAPVVGRFECSNELLNRIQHNIVWALRSNLMSVPTDCPQRDERLGWLGDAHVFAPTACWNMDMSTFFAKWLRDICDSQHESGYVLDVAPAAVLRGPAAPGWGDAIVGIPWNLYRFYGDTRVIEENFDTMRAWVEYMRRHAPNYLYRCPHELKEDGYGDWVATVESPKRPIAAAFFYYSTRLLANMADIIGRGDDAARYANLAGNIRVAFNNAFFDSESNNYEGATQTANVLPLAFGLAPAERRSAVLKNVVRAIEACGTHLTTGFLGTAYALPLLSKGGHHQLAFQLATRRSYPSWGYMVDCGATTMCELWNPHSGDPRMNSWNHFALGTIGQWFFEALGGINLLPAAPVPGDSLSRGVLIRPRPVGDLEWAQAEYESTNGMLRSAWRWEQGAYRFHLTIPANTAARVCVPTFGWTGFTVAEGETALLAGAQPVGEAGGLQYIGLDLDRFALFDAGSGSYSFTVTRRDRNSK
jgi:alpha-L-rhamnosidase